MATTTMTKPIMEVERKTSSIMPAAEDTESTNQILTRKCLTLDLSPLTPLAAKSYN